MKAQDPGLSYEYLDINKIKARHYNASDMYWDLEGLPSLEVPQGSNNNSGFASSIWIGGLDLSSNLHMAAQTYRQIGEDFFPGPWRSTGDYDISSSFEVPFTAKKIVSLSSDKLLILDAFQLMEYDPSTQTSQTYTFPNPRLYAGVVELPSGNYLVYGDGNFPFKAPLVEIDHQNFTATTLDSLQLWQGPAAVELLDNGEILFAGALGCELYSPTNGSSTLTASLGASRVRAGSLKMSDGRVLVAGGTATVNGGTGLVDVEIYDPNLGTWATLPDMLVRRRDFNMVELPTGEVLMIGGSNTDGDVEQYNPVTGNINTVGNLETRFFETVLQVRSDSTVIIAGNDDGNVKTNLLVFDPITGTSESQHVAQVRGIGAILSNGNIVMQNQVGTVMEIDSETGRIAGQKWQRVWKVNKADIDSFRIDFQTGNVDFDRYPDILDWPAHGSIADGEDRFLAPFVDVNCDSLYDPAGAGDYPCIMGDQALWWVFNDAAGAHTSSGGTKLDVQVEVMAYAFECDTCPIPWLDHMMFYHYEVENKGFTAYNDAYISIWADAEVGNFWDDHIGMDSMRGLGFIYNGDDFDEGLPTYPEYYEGYGANPPSNGFVTLNSPVGEKPTHFIAHYDTLGVVGFPIQPEEFYNIQQAKWIDGTPLTLGGDGYNSSSNKTNFMFSGDPGFCGPPASGWFETDNASIIWDRQASQSHGPFDFPALSSINFDYAYIYARSYNFENLASVCELKAAADFVRPWFKNLDKSCIGLVVGRDGKLPSIEQGNLSLFPNPADDQITLQMEEGLRKSAQVRIFDPTGRLMGESVMKAGSTQTNLNVSHLPNGVYFMHLDSDEKVGTTRFVIQR